MSFVFTLQIFLPLFFKKKSFFFQSPQKQHVIKHIFLIIIFLKTAYLYNNVVLCQP
jgi:hypothetical protein